MVRGGPIARRGNTTMLRALTIGNGVVVERSDCGDDPSFVLHLTGIRRLDPPRRHRPASPSLSSGRADRRSSGVMMPTAAVMRAAPENTRRSELAPPLP